MVVVETRVLPFFKPGEDRVAGNRLAGRLFVIVGLLPIGAFFAIDVADAVRRVTFDVEDDDDEVAAAATAA
jgi:hypothetical protein